MDRAQAPAPGMVTMPRRSTLHLERCAGSFLTREKCGPDEDAESAPAFLKGFAQLHSVPQALLRPPGMLSSIRSW